MSIYDVTPISVAAFRAFCSITLTVALMMRTSSPWPWRLFGREIATATALMGVRTMAEITPDVLETTCVG